MLQTSQSASRGSLSVVSRELLFYPVPHPARASFRNHGRHSVQCSAVRHWVSFSQNSQKKHLPSRQTVRSTASPVTLSGSVVDGFGGRLPDTEYCIINFYHLTDVPDPSQASLQVGCIATPTASPTASCHTCPTCTQSCSTPCHARLPPCTAAAAPTLLLHARMQVVESHKAWLAEQGYDLRGRIYFSHQVGNTPRSVSLPYKFDSKSQL